ncbi:glycosyltransferase involved in cell wall biosynthesis [Dysgonomonas hofstadii]|uniref:Glycosyltransferase involved in cell wall biosynthesis n=1 Tax=Dysgonomonas hofstadii TaxID=637886 RepID=A0A840CK77_9BACT|nr:glycosyltransferase [Dysgonomonas hofstadii]MBB4035069.1 glycosyltransferase involved in cell wall biosynthesis [Dysgonomonas hofstadii]
MKILHVNTKDTGGAANACMRIHKTLIEKGIDSKVLLLHKTKDIPETYQFDYWNNIKNRIDGLYRSLKSRYYKKKLSKFSTFRQKYPVEAFTNPQTIYDITKHPLYKEADIIQLNWVSGFLDEPSFFRKNKKPVVWRMADLYICGGGNHYEKEFPFGTYHNMIKKNYKIRKNSLTGKKINIVAISNWTKSKAEKSELLKGNPITVIQNGIDSDIFKQFDKKEARELLGLPLDKRIILFGAEALLVKRKGMDLLLEAINRPDFSNYLFCAFGNSPEWLQKNIFSLGLIHDENKLSLIYSAADIFVMPSIEETFGQVIIESLSCGTPVVSFPTGGALDVIRTGFNGIITDHFSSDDLANAIQEAINTHFDNNKIREDILSRFNIKIQTDKYIELYKSILNKESVI